MVLVDSPVWSEFLRRARPQTQTLEALQALIEGGEALLIGSVRQEILCGIKDLRQFERLRAALRAFPDVPILIQDHEEAAAMFNLCRAQGVQGSNTDFLICAVSKRLGTPIFTLDRDFEAFDAVLGIQLFRP